jgi:hypothetical protein
MQRIHLSASTTYRAALLGAIAIGSSVLTALGVVFIVRSRQSRTRNGIRGLQVERIPIQPAVDTAVPSQAPDHFSEDLLVPGRTYTGPEIVQQDIEEGRSPEGV